MSNHLPTAMRQRLAERANLRSDRGSLLVDTLIGLALFTIIIIWAVSAAMNYYDKAHKGGAESDAKALGIAVEAHYTANQEYPATADFAGATLDDTLENLDVKLSENNHIEGYIRSADGKAFAFCVEHKGGAYAGYNSADGGVFQSDTEGGCESL